MCYFCKHRKWLNSSFFLSRSVGWNQLVPKKKKKKDLTVADVTATVRFMCSACRNNILTSCTEWKCLLSLVLCVRLQTLCWNYKAVNIPKLQNFVTLIIDTRFYMFLSTTLPVHWIYVSLCYILGYINVKIKDKNLRFLCSHDVKSFNM